MKKLIIVESPSKIKTLQKFLGSDFIILPSYGHMVDLAKGGRFGIGVDLLNGLKPHYVLMQDKMDAFNKIVEASELCDTIYIASDPDREGSAISYNIYNRLQSTGKPIKRISFNEITKTAVLAAIASPREVESELDLIKAQQARRILDRVVGFMVSPLLISVFGQSLSAGRVQSVAVRMVVEREAEIKAFKPKEYWNLFADVQDSTDKFRLKYDGELSNKNDTDAVIAAVTGQPFVVDSVVRKPKKEKAPPPLTTLVLQQLMAKKHGFDAERTMKAAQTCYEAGYTTYIRTDSVRLSDDAVKSIRAYLKTKGYTVPAKANEFESKDTAADSHEAIRCTNVSNEPDTCMLTGDEKLVYDIVWRYSVACQMEPAVFDTLEVKVRAAKHTFRAAGKALSVKGYLEVLPPSKDSKIEIPNLNVGDQLSLIGLSSEQKFTQPPPRYTEANLIKELDSRQIGRPSTMATILKNINGRNYVQKNGNVYHPTDLGIKVSDLLTKYFGFINMNYSALMESNLDKIAAGQASYDTVMKDFFSAFSVELEKAIKEYNKVSCDKCHGLMVERSGTRGKFMACSGCRNSHSVEA